MAVLNVLRVFVGEDGGGGNPLGVFLQGDAYPTEKRQPVATDLNYSETVFVDDPDSGALRIFTPAAELPFAGHPLVGTAWLLNKEGHAVDALRPPAGVVPVTFDGDTTWIRGRPEWSPKMDFIRYDSPEDINVLSGPPDGIGFAYCWSWEDETAGRVRVRVFVPEHNIDEDEATGSGAVAFAAHIGRAVTVNQGVGSLLKTQLHDDGAVSVGGAVTLTETRDYQNGITPA
ncbi:MAG: PhzF family phenazine biosynthesis protein [Chloroflexi bacterium]|nr:PhzF family phenazine biosynthesis protein [Chloroflexota bacterium]MBT4073777.1 PhzF family phenazine biosynthesis protein [Chloroflexota bacterium]MBT4514444.1 PhzF family phenazine biosynthesis protein [Chloroflexota bacterium]MBT5318765.1 PhzF family phenazine biosynthesis protein [Chloroflexota bacterium]